jgi:uncharacterized protein (TIGR00369 family)
MAGPFFMRLTAAGKSRIQAGMKEIISYPGCFVCGGRNVHGLQAKFHLEGEQAVSEIMATTEFEGYKGIFHGGVVASLLDEVMVKAILAQDVFAVTAEMTVRYIKPVRIGERIRFIGRIISHRGRHYTTEGEAVGEDGARYATATGIYLEAKSGLKQELITSAE